MNNFIQSVLGLPLTDPVNGGIYIAILVISALLIAWRLRKRDVVSFLLAAVIATVAFFVLKHWDVPFYLFVAGLVPIAALISLIHHAGRRVLMAVIAAFSALAVAGLANMEYQSYPDIASLDPTPVAQEMDYSQFKAMKSSDSAAIVHVDLPGAISGFSARQAIAYIPPAYWSKKDINLPVLVLLHGNPGGPEQWFGSGEAAETADAFQRANGGLSPIVVAVDATGSETANPICADTSVAKVMTYLTTDVPTGIKTLAVSTRINNIGPSLVCHTEGRVHYRSSPIIPKPMARQWTSPARPNPLLETTPPPCPSSMVAMKPPTKPLILHTCWRRKSTPITRPSSSPVTGILLR